MESRLIAKKRELEAQLKRGIRDPAQRNYNWLGSLAWSVISMRWVIQKKK
jgi:hypothetical protein